MAIFEFILRSTTAKNSFLLACDRFSSMISMFIIGVIVARIMGPESYGIYGFSISLVNIFLTVSNVGLSSLIVRELVHFPEEKNSIFSTALVLKLAVSIISIFTVWGLLFLFDFDPIELKVIFVLSFTIPLSIYTLVEFWFQSIREIKNYVAIKCSLVFIFLFAKALVVYTYADLYIFSFVHLFYVVLLTVSLGILFFRDNRILFSFSSVSSFWMKRIGLDGGLIFISTILAILFLRADVLMIRYLGSTAEVGIYNAALQLSELWYVLPTLIMTAYFPSMAAKFASQNSNVTAVIRSALTVFSILAIWLSIFMSLFGDKIVIFIFGNDFLDSVAILLIHIWSSVFVFQRIVISKWLVLKRMYWFALLSQLLGLLINIFLNIFLYQIWGLNGIAIATLTSYAISNYLIFFVHSSTREVFKEMTFSILRTFTPKTYFNLFIKG